MRAGGSDLSRVRVRLALLPLAGWAVLAGVGYYPTTVHGGWPAVMAMLAAQVVVVTVVYVTLLPTMSRMVLADGPGRLRLAFKAAFSRFMLTLALAGAVAWQGTLPTSKFLVWASISYVIMIKVETIALIGWMRTLERRACT